MLSINFDCDSAPLLAAVAIVVKHAFLLQSCSLGVGQVLIYESMHSFAEKVTTFRLDDLLQVSASASHSSSQPLAAGEDEPGLLLLPGRHSYNFKLGSSKGDSLSPTQSACFHQV